MKFKTKNVSTMVISQDGIHIDFNYNRKLWKQCYFQYFEFLKVN